MNKNPSPLLIAIVSPLLSSLLLLLVLQVLNAFSEAVSLPLWALLGLPVGLFLVSFFLTYQALQRFIYRKIKIIYKRIAVAKDGTLRGKDIKMSEDILSRVDDRVEEWSKNQANEIKNYQQMEQFRKEFLGNVSHELKTPIFNIQGYLDTLIDGGLEDVNVNYSYLDRASKNTERLIKIVEDLGDISTMESGQIGLEISRFDINALTKEVFSLNKVFADERKVTLSIKPGCDNSFWVNADRSKINQVLTNLISNSIKYAVPNGETQVGFYEMGERILIEVSDNGIGIKKKDLPRLFERFYRVDKSRSRDAGGTGLGLAIVKHILELHNERINVRSTVGKGSTFGFSLARD